MNPYRLAQITDTDGQGWIALIRHNTIIGRFTNWADARAAYRVMTRKP